ncbi:MAG: hypothetical protein ACFFAQ_13710 [Promethearchaeota archaeon]
MSKRTTIIGIVVLVLGAVAVPTGIFLNDYIRNLVREGVPEALLKIEDDATESLEDQIPPLATPDVLLGIEDEALLQLEAQLPVLATPQVLDELKDEAIAQLPLIINGSGAALAINQSIDGAAAIAGDYDVAKEDFFNSPTFQADYSPFIPTIPQGVSDYYDTLSGDFDFVNLSYTTNAQNYLLYGNGPLPGLITDLELGLGLLGYMELYLNASLGVPGVNATMQAGYNANWAQLSALAGYIKDYLWDVVVKSQYSPLPIEVYAEILFYVQWSNGTLVEDGIDLSLFKSGIPPGTKGLEAGVPNPTNITLTTCTNLWDDSNPLSFVNDLGIMAWINVSYQTMIEMSFGISTPQYLLVLVWLSNFITNLTPLLIEAETGYTIPQLAQLAFYEQWANGTIQGQPILSEGFLSQLDPSFAGAPYFEVGIPTPSNFSLLLTMGLWDESIPDTFVNMAGIEIWLRAADGSTDDISDLASAFAPFGLTPSDLTNILLPWLGAFYTIRVPDLLLYDTGYTIPELAQFALWEQWANGTINGLPILTEGFLSLRDPPIYGPPYFEVGLTEGATGLTIPQCMALWNEASEYSLVTKSGINKWYNAKPGNTVYDDLKLNNGGISDGQMAQILSWLPKFRDDIVTELAIEEYNLPSNAYTLADGLLYGLMIPGIALLALGGVALGVSIIKRKS